MQTIGKYQVLEVLGQGGMGVVYRARDNAIGRQVALKVMRPEVMNSADLRERFLREARAAGNLQHPNIVVVYDLGEDNGSPYIAMEFLGGEGLDKALDAGSLNTTEKLQLFTQICDGLQFAHEAGVVHRDIKPANVMIVRSGAKLLDFGIARMAGSQITRNTAIIGTVSYMSPEQIRGKGVDARSDIFSAGVMLYEMLSGRRPFDQDSDFDTMQAIVAQDPPELEVEGVISPDALATIVRRSLDKDPAKRYQSAQGFGDAVRGYLRSQERSGTAPTVVRARPEPQREVAPTIGAISQPAASGSSNPLPAAAAGSAAAVSPQRDFAPPASAQKRPSRTRVIVGLVVSIALFLGGIYGAMLYRQAKEAGQHLPNYGTAKQVPVQMRLVTRTGANSLFAYKLTGTEEWYVLDKAVIVDESDLASATASYDANGRPQLVLNFNQVGAAKLRSATAENLGKEMGILVGGELRTIATIQTELSDSITLTGMQTLAEAEEEAKRINGEAP